MEAHLPPTEADADDRFKRRPVKRRSKKTRPNQSGGAGVRPKRKLTLKRILDGSAFDKLPEGSASCELARAQRLPLASEIN